MNDKSVTAILGLLGLGIWTSPVFGQEAQATSSVSESQLIWLFITVAIIIALVALVLAITIFYLVYQKKAEVMAQAKGEAGEAYELEPFFSWDKVRKVIWRSVPVSEEKSVDMGHDYDGIRELDNALPPWWKWGFYITIFFSGVYLYYFHLSGNDWSSKQEYEIAMAEAEEQKAAFLQQTASQVDETNVTTLTGDAQLASGKDIYMTNCVACHGDQGQGGVGPNLADPYWLHGGSIKDVFATVKYGVPEKGMIAWQDQLRPSEIQEVSSYIMTFQGTNPPNAKEAQGELFVPQEAAPADSTAADTATVITMR